MRYFMFAGLTSLMSSGAHVLPLMQFMRGLPYAIKPANLVMAYWWDLATLLLALENRSDEELLEAIGLARACAIPLSLREIAELDSTEWRGLLIWHCMRRIWRTCRLRSQRAHCIAPLRVWNIRPGCCSTSAAYPDGGKREYAVSLLSVFVRAGAHCESVKRITPFAHQNGLTLERRRVGEKIELHQRVAVPLIEWKYLSPIRSTGLPARVVIGRSKSALQRLAVAYGFSTFKLGGGQSNLTGRMGLDNPLLVEVLQGRCEQVPDMRSSYSSGAHPRGTS